MSFDMDDAQRRMQGAVSALETEFQGLRTGGHPLVCLNLSALMLMAPACLLIRWVIFLFRNPDC